MIVSKRRFTCCRQHSRKYKSAAPSQPSLPPFKPFLYTGVDADQNKPNQTSLIAVTVFQWRERHTGTASYAGLHRGIEGGDARSWQACCVLHRYNEKADTR